MIKVLNIQKKFAINGFFCGMQRMSEYNASIKECTGVLAAIALDGYMDILITDSTGILT